MSNLKDGGKSTTLSQNVEVLEDEILRKRENYIHTAIVAIKN